MVVICTLDLYRYFINNKWCFHTLSSRLGCLRCPRCHSTFTGTSTQTLKPFILNYSETDILNHRSNTCLSRESNKNRPGNKCWSSHLSNKQKNKSKQLYLNWGVLTDKIYINTRWTYSFPLFASGDKYMLQWPIFIQMYVLCLTF